MTVWQEKGGLFDGSFYRYNPDFIFYFIKYPNVTTWATKIRGFLVLVQALQLYSDKIKLNGLENSQLDERKDVILR